MLKSKNLAKTANANTIADKVHKIPRQKFRDTNI